ncbi:RpiB/LacA/LacB family sugar-phosphate isomerase [Spiroplasma sp. DGKH1]|uniref:RpiB/LacA/LacB family sugar-phosphate isomerase n=1 Tax=Spiroplasma sp. DGKH1 TaxID=3050074 RepID=UPI0034C5D46B
MKIAIGTNKFLGHLEMVKDLLTDLQYEIIDVNNKVPKDIFEASFEVAKLVNDHQADRGIIIDEFGNGGFMVAAKFKNNIVAQLSDEHSAHMTREHNNANIITLGAELTGDEALKAIVTRYFATEFAGGRHLVRTDMLGELLKEEQ